MRTAGLGLALVAFPLFAGAALLQLEYQRGATGAGWTEIIGTTRFGTLWLVRLLLVLAAAILVGLLSVARSQRRDGVATPLIVALTVVTAGIATTIPLLSHAAAAPGSAWAMLAHAAHLLLASAWCGGLAVLVVALLRSTDERERDDDLRMTVIGRFSLLAGIGLFVLGFTGVVRALGEVATPYALVSTGYGRWLLVKLGFVAIALMIAARNRDTLDLWRRKRTKPRAATGHVRRRLPYELGAAALVMVSVAFLGQTPTPRSISPGGATGIAVPFNHVTVVDDVAVHLQVSPARIGENTVRIHPYRADGQPLDRVEAVLVSFGSSLLADPGGGQREAAASEGNGFYRLTGSFFTLAMQWRVRVDIRQAGADDLRVDFTVPIADGVTAAVGERSVFGVPAPQLSQLQFAALLASPLTALALWWRSRRGRAWTLARMTGWAAGAFAVIVMFFGPSADSLRGHIENPSAGDPVAIARGGQIYAASCAACHGTGGRGDGPAGVGLSPPPVDFAFHIPYHDDASIFDFIAHGLAGTAMPAWEAELSEEQIWDLVNYLRSEFPEPLAPP